MCIEKTEVMNIKNTSGVINDKDNGNAENIMSLLIYMVNKLKIPKEVYYINNLNNEPGQSYVWLKQSTSNAVSENNVGTKNIIDCILKGKNSTVEVQKNKMNSVTNLSDLVSAFCKVSQKNKKKRKRKKIGEEIMVQCFMCFKCWKIHDKCFKHSYGK